MRKHAQRTQGIWVIDPMVSGRAEASNRSDSPICTVVLTQEVCDLWLRRCKIPQTSQPPEEDGVATGQRGEGFRAGLSLPRFGARTIFLCLLPSMALADLKQSFQQEISLLSNASKAAGWGPGPCWLTGLFLGTLVHYPISSYLRALLPVSNQQLPYLTNSRCCVLGSAVTQRPLLIGS